MGMLVLVGCGEEKRREWNEGLHIIPWPSKVVEGEGWFKLKKGMVISVPEGAEGKRIGGYLSEKLRGSTGWEFEVEEGGEGVIRLELDKRLGGNVEGYRLRVHTGGVSIKAGGGAGLFYGVQTLLQLLPAEIERKVVMEGITWKARCVEIEDAPRFGYRGMLVDACRHFVSVERLKKQLDVLALFKINRLHWHLTDDQGWRIEIRRYPLLTEVGGSRIEGEGYKYEGYYTQAEIREVIAYASDRYITIVPEIEMPGHGLGAISAYPGLSCRNVMTSPRNVWGVEDIVFCAGKDNTYRFLEDVLKEVCELFPGEYIHLGGDECPKREWERCPACQHRIKMEGLEGTGEVSSEARLQSYFMGRMEAVLTKHGKKMIGWDEILEGGLSGRETVVMSWRGEAGGVAAAEMGHDVIMTPGSAGLYIDQYEGDAKVEPVAIGGYSTVEKIYGYDPVPEAVKEAGLEKHIKGVQCNVWGEYLYTPEKMEYRAYPRIVAGAEIGWSSAKGKDSALFLRRLDNALVRLESHGINYHIPLPEQEGGSLDYVTFVDTVSLRFKTSRPERMVYTLDGSEPDYTSDSYMGPIKFSETTELKIRTILRTEKMSAVRTIVVEKRPLQASVEVETNAGLDLWVTPGKYLHVASISKEAKWERSTLSELSELTTQEAREWGGSVRNVQPYAAVAAGYVHILSDGVYCFATDNEELWIDGERVINNEGEVKRYTRHDAVLGLKAGLHEVKVVFLSHTIGGWPTIWGDGSVRMRKLSGGEYAPIKGDQLRRKL